MYQQVYYYNYKSGSNLNFDIGGRCDRGKAEYKKYLYIPIEELNLLSTL